MDVLLWMEGKVKMKVLGIESSGLMASVAIVDETTLLAEYSLNNKKNHSQTLMPMIESLTKLSGIDLKTLDLIAFSEGPGSYTGLRIGCATAKGLAHGLDLPIVGVPTLDVLAANVLDQAVLICAIEHARKEEVYWKLYRSDGQSLTSLTKSLVSPWSDVIMNIQSNPVIKEDMMITFVGSGALLFENELRANLGQPVQIPQAINHLPVGKQVANLGLICFYGSMLGDYYTVKPNYVRKSQAERTCGNHKGNETSRS